MHLRTVVTVTLIGMLAFPACAQLNPGPFAEETPRPGPAAYSLEGLGAVGMGVAVTALPAFLFLAASYNSPLSDNSGSYVPVIFWGCATLTAYSAGSGLGAVLVGQALHLDGNTGESYGLAFMAPLIGVGALIVYGTTGSPVAGYASAVSFLAGPPILATVGYNMGSSLDYARSHDRFQPPSFAARLERSGEAGHRAVVAFDARLLSVRF